MNHFSKSCSPIPKLNNDKKYRLSKLQQQLTANRRLAATHGADYVWRLHGLRDPTALTRQNKKYAKC